MILIKLFLVLAFTLTKLNIELSDHQAPAKNMVKWSIEKSSTIKVSGKSNVNAFTCEIPGYFETDTIMLHDEGKGKEVKLNGTLDIDVFKFDCHNSLITKDFRKTLKTKEYPRLQIRFISLEQLPSFQNTTEIVSGKVEVSLAGVHKTFAIPFQFVKSGAVSIQLNGTKAFHFSDFKLSPPKKLIGMIKVKDEFTVEFRLKLNVVK